MNRINLANKKILYLGPASRHYDQCIVNKLKESGAIVEPFDLFLDTFYFKILKKLKLENRVPYKKNYYDKAFIKNNYDYILVRHICYLDPVFYERLRKLNPDALFIMFHWDSIKPSYNYKPVMKYFDRIYSFDYKDCQEDKRIKYLPLFFIDEYAEFRKSKENFKKKFDILFIGGWRDKERYNLIRLTEKNCNKNGLSFYYYLYFSLQQHYDSIKKGIIPGKAKTKSLSHKEILDLFSVSDTIIDFPSSFQTGLTMRTFETLGAGKKLITTNKNILTEPFYDPQYINVVDINNFYLDIDFIKSKPSASIEEKMNDYSIEGYLNKLFSE